MTSKKLATVTDIPTMMVSGCTITAMTGMMAMPLNVQLVTSKNGHTAMKMAMTKKTTGEINTIMLLTITVDGVNQLKELNGHMTENGTTLSTITMEDMNSLLQTGCQATGNRVRDLTDPGHATPPHGCVLVMTLTKTGNTHGKI